MSDHRIVIKDAGLAEEMNRITTAFESQLVALLDRARGIEQAEDFNALATGVGHVIAIIGQDICFPLYRTHPALTPEIIKSCMDKEAQPPPGK
jgi:hypothetical protein